MIKDILLSILIIVAIFAIVYRIALADVKYKNREIEKNKVKGTLFWLTITHIIVFFCVKKIPFVKNFLESENNGILNNILLYIGIFGLALLIFLIIEFVIRKIEIKKKEKKVELEEINFYRDLIKDIPVAILGYINNKDSKPEDLLISTLLDLEKKGYLKVDEKVEIISEPTSLTPHEMYCITMVSKETDVNYMMTRYMEILKRDAIDGGYYNKNRILDASSYEFFNSFVNSFFLVSLILVFLAFALAPALAVLLFVDMFVVMLSHGLLDYDNILCRTPKAVELKNRLNGLNRFLNKMTNIDDKSLSEIGLYDDYILYAIIFDIKGELDIETTNKINKIKEIKRGELVLQDPSGTGVLTLLIFGIVDIIMIFIIISTFAATDGTAVFGFFLLGFMILMNIGFFNSTFKWEGSKNNDKD